MTDVEVEQYYFIRILPGEYGMDFEICEKIINNNKETNDIKIKGFLKWDGCMNWDIKNGVMYHFCNPEDADLLNKCFKKVWELGPKYIDKWLDD